MHARASIFLARDQNEIIAGIERGRISHLSLVPTQLNRMLDAGADFAGVHAIAIGGDALQDRHRQRARALGLPVHETYGLTETASMIWAYDAKNDAGGLLPHAAIKFSAEGEILVGGESLFDGYADHDAIAGSFNDGFFPTGDLGRIHGHELIVEGRKHHRIISGGENIQAEEIERVIELHPDVASCVVIGLPDHDLGMRPCAIIKWRDRPCHRSVLVDHLKHHIASFKIPKTIIKWPSDAPEILKKPRLWLQQWLLGWTNLS
jgi:O-succinylbenzoic acid--CoA ligase